jgi:hypothetical protein
MSPYKFEFSNTKVLAGSAVCATFAVILLTIFFLGLGPALSYETDVTPNKFLDKYSSYGWVTYLLVFNGLLLLLGGKALVSIIAYPYSNWIFRRSLSRTTN